MKIIFLQSVFIRQKKGEPDHSGPPVDHRYHLILFASFRQRCDFSSRANITSGCTVLSRADAPLMA